jgi:Rad51 protein
MDNQNHIFLPTCIILCPEIQILMRYKRYNHKRSVFTLFIRYYTVTSLSLGNQHTNQQKQQQQLKYYCSKCDTLLKKTRDGFDNDFKFSNSKEECPYCGSLISKTLRKENVHGTATTNNMGLSSSSSLCLLPLPPKIQTAYEQFSNRLTFGIEKIDSVLQLTTGETVCIVSTDHNNNKYANNILLSRLCVRAIMSNRQGGFNSPKVILVDVAGNTSDIYQCVNFARQYGLNIKKTLQSIVVSRSFTIYQLANIIINELPKVLEQLSGAKVIVIGNLLSLFVNDPQVQIKEAKSLIRQIANAVKMYTYNSNILCVISFCSSNNTKMYARLILEN